MTTEIPVNAIRPNRAFDTINTLNNFNLLRFLAATLVIYTHCYGLKNTLPDKQHDYFAYFIYSLGNVGVDTFFIISGFLITKSYLTRNNLFVFIRARALRLYPGLLCSLVFACFLIGPFNTTLPLPDYFNSEQLKVYFFYNLSLIKTILPLPGVFSDNFIPDVNGSLWTLPAEARMYLLIAGFGLSGILAKRSAYTLAILCAAIVYLIDKDKLPLLSDNPLYYKLSWFFFSGSLFYSYREYIHLNNVICASLITLLFSSYLFFPDFLHPIYGIILPYITLWFAFNVHKLHAFNNLGDYSYGIYIYSFPIQQFIVSCIPDITIIPFFYLSLPLTLMIAIPSWHFIEKPALQYK